MFCVSILQRSLINKLCFVLFCHGNRVSRATMTQLLFNLNGSSSIIFVTGSSCGVIRKFVVVGIFSSRIPRLLAVCFSLESGRDYQARRFRKGLGRDTHENQPLFVHISLLPRPFAFVFTNKHSSDPKGKDRLPAVKRMP